MAIGCYRWRQRRTAFRNDYCMSCQRQVRADCIRAFVVVYVKFIPLLPLGFWKRWQCSVCERPPSCPPTARTSILYLGAVVFGLFGLLMWWVGLTVDHVETAAMLGIGTGFCAASVGLLLWCHQRNFAPSYAERFADVTASDEISCPGCGAELQMSPIDDTMECADCGIQRL